MAEKEKKSTEGLPQPPQEIVVAETKLKFDWKRVLFISIGLGLFFFLCHLFSSPYSFRIASDSSSNISIILTRPTNFFLFSSTGSSIRLL